MLSINRVICLTNLDRAAEALPDVQRLLSLPADKDGRGAMNAHFETLALAALHAGDVALGAELVDRASQVLAGTAVPDEQRHAARGPGRAADGARAAGPMRRNS